MTDINFRRKPIKLGESLLFFLQSVQMPCPSCCSYFVKTWATISSKIFAICIGKRDFGFLLPARLGSDWLCTVLRVSLPSSSLLQLLSGLVRFRLPPNESSLLPGAFTQTGMLGTLLKGRNLDQMPRPLQLTPLSKKTKQNEKTRRILLKNPFKYEKKYIFPPTFFVLY